MKPSDVRQRKPPDSVVGLSPGLEQLAAASFLNLANVLTRIETKLDALILQGTENMAALDDAIQTLNDRVTENTTIVGSTKVFIAGLFQQLMDALAAASNAGATPAQLQKLTELAAAVKANDDDLAAAITANTPAAV